MKSPVSRNVLVICLTVIVLFAMTAIIAIDVANRSTGQAAQQLVGLLAPSIAAIAAVSGIEKVKAVVQNVQQQVNGHLDAHQSQTTALAGELAKVDPGNPVLKEITDVATDVLDPHAAADPEVKP